MPYPTDGELATYLGATNDTTLQQCNAAAADFVVKYCNREFVPYSATYEFTRKNITMNGGRLMFFRDCLSITTLTNGDGSVIAGANFRKLYLPTFRDPQYACFYGVQLLPTNGYRFVEGLNGFVSVLGSWGYDGQNQPPKAIFEAILMIAAQIYRARSGGGGQIAQVQPSGVMVAGVELSQLVIDMLKPFQRVVL